VVVRGNAVVVRGNAVVVRGNAVVARGNAVVVRGNRTWSCGATGRGRARPPDAVARGNRTRSGNQTRRPRDGRFTHTVSASIRWVGNVASATIVGMAAARITASGLATSASEAPKVSPLCRRASRACSRLTASPTTR